MSPLKVWRKIQREVAKRSRRRKMSSGFGNMEVTADSCEFCLGGDTGGEARL